MSFLERQSTRITGTDHGRGNSVLRATSSGKIPNAKKARSRPPTSLRDHLPYPNATLPASSGPYSVGSMEIEVPVQNPRPISDIKRHGRHILQLETVLFTLYYPASFGSGSGKAPGGAKKWTRETWLPRPRVQTAKGYAEFAGLPHWAGIALSGGSTMLTKLRAYQNSPLATHWPPEGTSKKCGYKLRNQQGRPPEGMNEEPTFPLLMFSHGLGGSKTAYSTLCSEFASYGFVVCAVEHRDGSGPRTFINHKKRGNNKKDRHGGAKVEDETDCDGDPEGEKAFEKWEHMDHTEEEIRKGYHHLDYIFPKNNPKDTSPNNERGVDGELRSAQIELRLCELEEAYRVLKIICAGDGEEIARQNLRSEGYVGGSSRGLQGVDWALWKHRFHIDKMTMAGHSFGAATVVEVLRHTDRFTNVQAGIIYDIWGAPIKPPADDPKHRIHLPLLGISSEAFMYWEKNWDAVMSLMNEASEHGAPAYLLTVRGSVHISQSDFSILYRHITSFFMKATVHPQRAIDLNVSTSLEFLRLVTPLTGGGRAIIDRCMTNEELLDTALLEEIPDDHRPDDEWIAARLRVDHEFRTRMAAGLQRKFKRNFKGGMGTGYSTSDEMWCHYKPTDEELQKWIEEGRGEQRIDEDHATKGAGHDKGGKDGNEDESTSASDSRSDIKSEVESQSKEDVSEGSGSQTQQPTSSEAVKDRYDDEEEEKEATHASPAAAADASESNDAPPETWLGLKTALRDGPQQS
ncbi:uncharacterized protein K460DRAFT_373502 [Cucurbitaria berberidis CBS 394.84]|uniref:1-alkyl-2-acetylglycerophosphocholine esterase n=1 Tax=Cucurbitaria berberidis CBS 394.84 TaxID=1168544 RepID=A0A9P4GU25_9PLEO|nr:uncharacterized protein K460DRAFT_373502 [Cucurbitaria berberidis CBS 394.84]KAF1851506.1 hypothetical protein K460DRAFT_373502 [Cucurbitaria berberidis CBS 394.84]